MQILMKKRFIALTFISAVALTACGTKQYQPKDYVLTLDYQNDFKILQLTDLHMADKDNQEEHYKFLDLIFDDERTNGTDLVVVTGDLFTFASKPTAERLFNYLDEQKIPWTVTFGNHDEQCYFSVDWLTGYLNKLGKSDKSYCMFKDLQDDDVNGNCNFVINLMDGANVHDQLFIMDSNRYNYGEYFGYDCFHQDQIDWYERMVTYTKEQNGGTIVPSLMFYHIPLPEVNDAWEKGTKIYADGRKLEKSCPPDKDFGFFNKIHELGSTKAMFFGHDHINDFINEYQGIWFAYGIKSTDRIYHDDTMLGGRTITIHNDHSLGFENLYHTYEEIK